MKIKIVKNPFSLNNESIPQVLKFQWHLTERCNLNCRHCYKEQKYIKNEMGTREMLKVLEQYVKLLKFWSIKGEMAITGGEPLIRKDFFTLLEKASQYKDLFRINLLTNGTLITEKIAEKFKQLDIAQVQLSIEGREKINDEIRGKGTFKKIVKAAEILVRKNLHTVFSFTSHKLNYKEFPEVVKLGEKIGVDVVWTDRLVLIGNGRELKNLIFEPLELKKFYQMLFDISNNLKKTKSKTQVPLTRPLAFLTSPIQIRPIHCIAGKNLIVVMPNGDILPCRRLPIKIGNIKEKSLFEVWNTSKLLISLRKDEFTNTICLKCPYFKECGGGARCMSYNFFGNPFAPDPQCWTAFKKLPF